jgi:hypothetical protein
MTASKPRLYSFKHLKLLSLDFVYLVYLLVCGYGSELNIESFLAPQSRFDLKAFLV